MPSPSRPLDRERLALAYRIATRLCGRRHADEATLHAVTILTADAAPDRADRLRPRPTEPAPLVERLALWALHRASDAAVAEAARAVATETTPAVEVPPRASEEDQVNSPDPFLYEVARSEQRERRERAATHRLARQLARRQRQTRRAALRRSVAAALVRAGQRLERGDAGTTAHDPSCIEGDPATTASQATR